MKIWLILLAVLQSLWSVEAGLITFRYVANWSLFWSFAICAVIGVLDLTLYYWLAEKIRQLLIKWSYFNNWLDRMQSETDSWMPWCRRYGHWGLLALAFIPHLIFVGIAAQKAFRLKNGYWMLLIGAVLKVATIAYGLKIIEYFVR